MEPYTILIESKLMNQLTTRLTNTTNWPIDWIFVRNGLTDRNPITETVEV